MLLKVILSICFVAFFSNKSLTVGKPPSEWVYEKGIVRQIYPKKNTVGV